MFFLAHNIKYTDQWLYLATWGDEKKKIIESDTFTLFVSHFI